MTIEQLEQNHAAAEAVVKELEREIRQEIAAATKAINEKWAERLNAANAARYEARKAADEAMLLADARFPLTTLDEGPRVMTAPSEELSRQRVARAVSTPAAPSAETLKADAPAAAPSLDTGLQHGLT